MGINEDFDKLWKDTFEAARHSWEEVLTADEREGGPSPWGNSKYQTFEQCPYLYWAMFIKRMKPKDPRPPLEIGGLFHEARARYYLKALELEKTEVSDQELNNACMEAGYDIINRAEKVVPATAAEVRRLFQGWAVVFGPDTPKDDRFDTIGVEKLIEVNRGFPYSTRVDRIVAIEDKPAILEIKTAGKRTKDMLAGYEMDSQFLGQQYCWRHSKWYRKYGSLKYYVVDLTIKTAEMVCVREVVPISSKAMKDWEKAKRWTYAQMQQCEAYQYWPRIRANCVKYGRCGLTEHCAKMKANYWPGWVKKETGEY